MSRSRVLARRVFLVSAMYGILVLVPQYFLEERIGRGFPPPITHPERLYGFIGVALVWQFAFLPIARDVVRYRPLMFLAVAEKLVFAVPILLLYAAGRVAAPTTGAGAFDLLWAVLFTISYLRPKELVTAS